MKRVLLIALLLGSMRVHAITTTPTPIISPLVTDARLLFPQALLLEVTIPLPVEQIQRTTLTLSLPDAPLITVEYPDDQPYRFAKEYAVAEYRYEFADTATLPLFGVIRYRWQVQSAEGQEWVTTGDVVYQDTRTTWRTVTDNDNRLTFTLAQDAPIDAEALAQITSTLLDRVQQDTDSTETLKFLIYPSDMPIGCERDGDDKSVNRYLWLNRPTESVCNLALAEQVFRESGYQVVQIENAGTFARNLQRGIVERAYASVWLDSVAPAWFYEGVIGLYVSRAGDDMGIVQQQIRSGRPFTLAQMSEPANAETVRAWDAQSRTMMTYLLATYGVESVFRLARTLDDYTTFAEAYEAVLGNPISTLLPNWEAWIFTANALIASSYSIFAPITATPTPTFTPSPTRSLPTMTVTGTALPDATPRPRPTRTPIPPTATTTPLPAESFIVRVTPTPSLVNAAPAAMAMPSQALVLGAGGVLGVILLAIAFMAGRRR